MKRLLDRELLDDLPAADPSAIRSRRDIRRVNWWMGNARWIADTLRSQFPAPPASILDLGAGDGTLMLETARRLQPAWRAPVQLYLLDRRDVVAPETRRQFSRLGWKVETLPLELEAWIARPNPQTCGVAIANLFLHHFDDPTLARLFKAISSTAGAFIACEPRRDRRALLGTRLLWLLGCNYVTRHDALISVRAGFRDHELSALWPSPRFNLTEHPAGLASHLFFAQRSTPVPPSG